MHKKHWTQHLSLIDAVVNRQFKAINAQNAPEVIMTEESRTSRKLPARAIVATDEKLLVGRDEAARMLSISRRALDYLVANRELQTRRIGKRVLIPVAALKVFSRADHPSRLAG